jgi:hypothetical protein
MKEICNISFDGAEPDCDDVTEPVTGISERIAFEFGSGDLSQADLNRKNEVEEQLFSVVEKCFKKGECEPLDILALRWKKCNACNKELPMLIKEVVEPLRSRGVSVLYEEMDAKIDPGGKEIFLKANCQGTPCILVADPGSGEYRKAYEGRQGSIARLSNILKLPNPLFYGDLNEYSRPLSMFNINRRYDKKIITNSRSLKIW